ncbi:protein kinase [Aureococcus anophagefferens]|nr:protein kinase [Aureococcus anophagefferens]
MDRYDVGTALGQGQWGVVRKATRRADGVEVAIKKVRCAAGSAEGVNFQLLATDLEKVLYDGGGALVNDGVAKGYGFMLLDALAFLHSHHVLHRDVKPANLLISAAGVLKLADFGYARYVADPGGRMSYECCTLWYRPPELLLGAADYGPGVDAWGAGCILAELALRRPVFRGDSETDQLARIFAVLGSPDDASWPGVASLRKYVKFTDARSEDLGALLNATPATPLVARLLALDPNARPARRPHAAAATRPGLAPH